MRLSQDPGWSALLAAFAQAWGASPDGGSAAIRAHLDDVTSRLAAAQGRDPACLPRPPEPLPVTAQLPAALHAGRTGPAAPVSRALAAVASRLTWEWGYTTLPEDLARSYGYCEILGPRGPVQDDGLILGFVLFAPGTFYPPHAHQGIFESYLSVAGHWAQNDGGVEQPGSLVFNPPGTRHFITTGHNGPCLLAYAWVGESAKLGNPGMVLD
ncbi:dimethylsulfonioproprionate lyase family protein [Neotabrizicola shimadae]|uniref:Dimethlysulfonioproprionate lyase DddL n=1 Tax=Neotabrizicola shimadae TaxID=2807096 RepID=A0A8G1EDT5_9RHOB|nr:dimethylsulfonioproprionate lyase family protein [Neotabrizicola shimadae]QYZ69779.1 dimethlysulfonioproprionate lyase DddL [Neotabrizicola shimadae]